MKICPKCQQQFPNGFQYCPNDTEYLITNEEHVRRTRPMTPPPAPEPVELPPVSVVPIAKAPPEVIAPPTPARPIEQKPREVSAPPPPRGAEPIRPVQTEPLRPGAYRSEPVRPAQPPPRPEAPPYSQPAAGYGGTRAPQSSQPPTQQPPTQPWWESQTNLQSTQTRPVAPPSPGRPVAPASPGLPVVQTSNFGFAIPESPSLISRLFAGLKSIGEIFKVAPRTGPGAAGDFKFLLKDESLLSRISREIANAFNDFRRNPRVFMTEFVRGEGTNRFRRNALLAGSELALTGLATLYFLNMIKEILQAPSGLSMVNLAIIPVYIMFAVIMVGCFVARLFLLYPLIYRTTSKFGAPKVALELFNWTPIMAILLYMVLSNDCVLTNRIFPGRCVAPQKKLDVSMVLPPSELLKTEVKMEKKAAAKEKVLGGSKPKQQRAAGGGGGGRQQPTPPSKGVPPQMTMAPQIVLPNPEPPKIKNPTLPVAMTIKGDDSLRMPRGPIGDPMGVPAPPSSGPGTGGGIGRSRGTGVGGGDGAGAGPGRGFNTGGGDPNLGGGRSVEPMTASLRPTILYREKAKYTEEARQNKVQGTVVLQVVFHVNGQITEVKVVRGLPDGLTEKAIEAARKIRFNPAVKNGTPVSVRGQLEFSFNLY